MRRFIKRIATFAIAAMMIGAPVVANAEGKIDAQEQKVLAWIAANAGEDSAAYAVAKDQFAYTSNEMTEKQAATIKENIKAAKELNDKAGDQNTKANQAKMLEYISNAAEAAGGKAIAVADSKTLEASVAFVRVDESNPNVVVKMQVAAKEGSEVTEYKPEGDTVSIGGETYKKDANGNYQKQSKVDVAYACHIQTYGDKQGEKKNGAMAGTTGEKKRLEDISIKVSGNENLGITYTTHCQTYGWLPWSANGERNGTTGEAKRLEAIKIKLTGSAANLYDVYYRVHAQTYGWLNWAKNGEEAGTQGLAKRLEGIQIVVCAKGTFNPDAYTYKSDNANRFISKDGSTPVVADSPVPTVMYKTHVQTFGWENWVTNGTVAGTQGKAKRLEGINIKLTNKDYAGGISYRVHVQSYGWRSAPVADGVMAGTVGQAKRLEAIQISLTGEMAKHYDVYYRVHAQTYGWMGWAKNGESAGTEGFAKRLEAIQIVLVPIGQGAPAEDYKGIATTTKAAFVKK